MDDPIILHDHALSMGNDPFEQFLLSSQQEPQSFAFVSYLDGEVNGLRCGNNMW